MKYIRLLTLAVLATALGACDTVQTIYNSGYDYASASEENHLISYQKCPAVTVVEELSMLRQFASSTSQQPSNVKSSAMLSAQDSKCSYSFNSATIDLTLAFNGELGPKGRLSNAEKPMASYPYFVAITNRSGKILAKQIFSATLSYPPGASSTTYTEDLRQIIPIPSRNRARDYIVTIGFQLSDEELAYNRALLESRQAKAPAVEAQLLEPITNPNAPVSLTPQ